MDRGQASTCIQNWAKTTFGPRRCQPSRMAAAMCIHDLRVARLGVTAFVTGPIWQSCFSNARGDVRRSFHDVRLASLSVLSTRRSPMLMHGATPVPDARAKEKLPPSLSGSRHLIEFSKGLATVFAAAVTASALSGLTFFWGEVGKTEWWRYSRCRRGTLVPIAGRLCSTCEHLDSAETYRQTAQS